MLTVMNIITDTQWVFACPFGLVLGLVLCLIHCVDPFDPSVSAAQAEDNISYLATKVGSHVAVT